MSWTDILQETTKSKIVIKPVDKGGGIIITNHSDYVKACDTELGSETANGKKARLAALLLLKQLKSGNPENL